MLADLEVLNVQKLTVLFSFVTFLSEKMTIIQGISRK